jgi:hypothetical protein
MQNGFNSIQEASENMAADIQPKSETDQQIADLQREQEEERSGGKRTRRYKTKKNRTKKSKKSNK